MASNTTIAAVALGTGGLTAEALAPTVKWVLTGMPQEQMPESTPLLIAAALLVVGHVLVTWVMARLSIVAPVSEEVPHE